MQALVALRRHAAVAFLLSASLAWADPSPHIFMIRAYKCPEFSKEASQYRSLSGFRVQGIRGIYTALHGILGCKDIVAQVEGLGTPKVFASLAPTQVDIARDVVLLSSEELEQLPAEGLSRMTSVPWTSLERLQVIGHPHGVERQISTRLQLRNPPKVALENLVPPGPLQGLRLRDSPRPSSIVASIEGHLTRGHSGAPILAGQEPQKVVAIANGGLAQGAIEVSWAMPFEEIELSPKRADSPELVALERRLNDNLFAMDTEVPPSGSVSCFGRRLDAVRSVTLNDLLSSVDDPFTYQQLVFNYGLNGFPITFTIFRDIAAAVSLVIPEGWTLQGGESLCTAKPPSGAFELQYELFESLENPSMGQLSQAARQREYSTFCERNFVVDAAGSNWTSRPLIHRGIVARRRTYVRLERRCGPPYLPLTRIQSPMWSSLPRPSPPYPLGDMQCQPTSCLNNTNGVSPSPGFANTMASVPYPDAWAVASGVTPPEFVSGWGFGSFMASRTRNLSGTQSWNNTGFSQRLVDCTNHLSNSADCQQAYAQQRTWAVGVIAAVASAVSSKE